MGQAYRSPHIASTSTVRPLSAIGLAKYTVLTTLTGGLTNPAPGEFNFDGWRALQPIFDAAKLAGIFVVLRPGTCCVLP